MVAATTPKTAKATGKIVQVLGPVVDIEYHVDQLPEIYNAVEVAMDDGSTLVAKPNLTLATTGFAPWR